MDISEDAPEMLRLLKANHAVASMRNHYLADLVQLIGHFPGSCGEA